MKESNIKFEWSMEILQSKISMNQKNSPRVFDVVCGVLRYRRVCSLYHDAYVAVIRIPVKHYLPTYRMFHFFYNDDHRC